jgi:predicted DNA-binding transcriptional regulator AlpA
MDKEYLSIGEVQAFLGSSRSFLYNKVFTEIKPHSLGKRVYYKKEDLIKLLEEGGKK